MKITSHTGRGTTTHRVTSGDLARRAVTLSVAGALACLALAPTAALADQPTSEGGGTATSTRDKWSDMYDVAQRKEAMARDRVANADQLRRQREHDRLHQPVELHVRHRPKHRAGGSPPGPARQGTSRLRAAAKPCPGQHRGLGDSRCPGHVLPSHTLDQWTRRLIAVQLCSKAHIVPAVFLACAEY